MIAKLIVAVAALSLATACGSSSTIAGYDGLEQRVENHRVGSDPDQWIEMVNGAGEWERVGLIFSYLDDRGQCLKAISGLKRADPDNEFRCEAAN